jgi:hypothetical protein
MNHKLTTSVLTAAAVALSLSACTFDDPEITDAPPSAETQAEPAEAEAEEKAPDGVGKFGQVLSWENVDITVTEPAPFEPSEYVDEGYEFDHYIVVEVRLTNTGEELFDPTWVHLTASSGEQEAMFVADVEKGINGAPMTSVQPGKSAKWKEAFNVADPDDIAVEITPDAFTSSPVLLTK